MSLKSSEAVRIVGARGVIAERYGAWHGPDAMLRWSSVTKVFTAALVRSMVREGLIDWGTPLSEAGVPGAPGKITVGSLVTHSSGLPRILPGQGKDVQDPYAPWTTERFDREVMADLDTLVGGPAADGLDVDGGAQGYSNVGYAVLGRVAERILRGEWLDLVRDRVIVPILGRAGSFAVAGGQQGGVLEAQSLFGRTVPDWDLAGAFAPSGGLVSTLGDLVDVLAGACTADTVLSPGDGPHAWFSAEGFWWHNGGTLRSGSFVAVNPDSGSAGAAHVVGGFPLLAPPKAQQVFERCLGEHRDARGGLGAEPVDRT